MSISNFIKGCYIGKGGFAKCYQFKRKQSGDIFVGKIIPKNTSKSQDKWYREIKIHAMLQHKHVVSFYSYYEDYKNLYILLDLCKNKTLGDLLKRRGSLTEFEVRYFTKQIVSALKYIHSKKVIHRDLKLSNLFLDSDMQIKLGDFGLATQLNEKEDLVFQVCGTPNYIAPEIIKYNKEGYSYEVDVWSLGCIIYTLLAGKPPFYSSSVKETYQLILENNQDYLDQLNGSYYAQELIKGILNQDPKYRLTLEEIENHPFLNEAGMIPQTLCSSLIACAPSAQYIEQFESINVCLYKEQLIRIIKQQQEQQQISQLESEYLQKQYKQWQKCKQSSQIVKHHNYKLIKYLDNMFGQLMDQILRHTKPNDVEVNYKQFQIESFKEEKSQGKAQSIQLVKYPYIIFNTQSTNKSSSTSLASNQKSGLNKMNKSENQKVDSSPKCEAQNNLIITQSELQLVEPCNLHQHRSSQPKPRSRPEAKQTTQGTPMTIQGCISNTSNFQTVREQYNIQSKYQSNLSIPQSSANQYNKNAFNRGILDNNKSPIDYNSTTKVKLPLNSNKVSKNQTHHPKPPKTRSHPPQMDIAKIRETPKMPKDTDDVAINVTKASDGKVPKQDTINDHSQMHTCARQQSHQRDRDESEQNSSQIQNIKMMYFSTTIQNHTSPCIDNINQLSAKTTGDKNSDIRAVTGKPNILKQTQDKNLDQNLYQVRQQQKIEFAQIIPNQTYQTSLIDKLQSNNQKMMFNNRSKWMTTYDSHNLYKFVLENNKE